MMYDNVYTQGSRASGGNGGGLLTSHSPSQMLPTFQLTPLLYRIEWSCTSDKQSGYWPIKVPNTAFAPTYCINIHSNCINIQKVLENTGVVS